MTAKGRRSTTGAAAATGAGPAKTAAKKRTAQGHLVARTAILDPAKMIRPVLDVPSAIGPRQQLPAGTPRGLPSAPAEPVTMPIADLPYTAHSPDFTVGVLRTLDLLDLQVTAHQCHLVTSGTGTTNIVPDDGAGNAWLQVDFGSQHLGERAYTFVDSPSNPGSETPEPPPIPALAAESSRVVYQVEAGEQIPFTVAGILAAMSRMPLRVAPLAMPNSGAAELAVGVDDVVTSLGSAVLARVAGRLVLAKPSARAAKAPAAAPATDVIATATRLQLVRRLAAGQAIQNDAEVTVSPGPIGDILVGPIVHRRPRRRQPSQPGTDLTALELPFRLILSPSDQGGFAHSLEPVTAPSDSTRVELWHTRLGVRTVAADGTATVDERASEQRIVRAIWARDIEYYPGPPPSTDQGPFLMSLTPRERWSLVQQSSNPVPVKPDPIPVDRLMLSALGGWLDSQAYWDTSRYTSGDPVASWRHEARMGRDTYVRVTHPGYLFPFGMRCVVVTLTERRILDATSSQAYLYQRTFIALTEPTIDYSGRDMPFTRITASPLVTPDLDKPPSGTMFWPSRNGGQFSFTFNCLDHSGKPVQLHAPALFVPQDPGLAAGTVTAFYDANDGVGAKPYMPADGQHVAYAASARAGDTVLTTNQLLFTGAPSLLTSTPRMVEANVVIPATGYLTGSGSGAPVSYDADYVSGGFTGVNADAEIFLTLPQAPASLSFANTAGGGGFIDPSLTLTALSRRIGATADPANLKAGSFDPASFLDGLPKLFGLFELKELLGAVGLDGAPTIVTDMLDEVSDLIDQAHRLVTGLDAGIATLTDDAATAATDTLRQRAADGQAALQAALGPVKTKVTAFTEAISGLLALSDPSDLSTVTTKVGAVVSDLLALVTQLRTALQGAVLPARVRALVERPVNALLPALDASKVTELLQAITQFVNGFDPANIAVTARLDWKPRMQNWPAGGAPAIEFAKPDDALEIFAEIRASAKGNATADVTAELRNFQLNLLPGAELMAVKFDRIGFRASSGRKAEVDVVFDELEFLGVLGFIETLKQMIPFDGFSDPPFLDINTSGVTAGFDLALPNVAIGVFALENISLGADCNIPFLGDAVTVGFHFCAKESPFRLTVMCIGGGGWVQLRLSPKGMVLLEVGLEFGAELSIDLGVASGSVSIMGGMYLKLEASGGSLTGYFRIRGEVNVLGLISASITLEMSLTYDFDSGKMIGQASITVEVEVLFFSASVQISVQKQFAGSKGDPTMLDVMPLVGDESPTWSQYCEAFAPA